MRLSFVKFNALKQLYGIRIYCLRNFNIDSDRDRFGLA